jgi:hypothetical protein
VISAERTDQVDVPGAGHPGHLRAVRFGDLDRKGADAAGGAIDQHPLPGLDFSVVAKALECSNRCHRNRSRFLKDRFAGFKT